MKTFYSSTVIIAGLAVLLAGCSSDGGVLGSSLTTSSVDATKVAAAQKLDPACVALTAKIDALRKDGVTERVGQAAIGKTETVSVKRESLAKMTELDRANADYQTKCSAPGLARPLAPAAAAAASVPAAKVANAAPAAAKPVASKKAVVVAPAAVAVAPPVVPVQIAAPVAAVAPVAIAAPVPAPVAPVPAAAPAPVDPVPVGSP